MRSLTLLICTALFLGSAAKLPKEEIKTRVATHKGKVSRLEAEIEAKQGELKRAKAALKEIEEIEKEIVELSEAEEYAAAGAKQEKLAEVVMALATGGSCSDDEKALKAAELAAGKLKAGAKRVVLDAIKKIKAGAIWRMDLSKKNIGDAGAAALAHALPASKITELELSHNKIGDAGAAAIAAALPSSKLLGLRFKSNVIRDTGAKALAAVLDTSTLVKLQLDNNLIGDKGAAAIAKALPASNLKWLYLRLNLIAGGTSTPVHDAWRALHGRTAKFGTSANKDKSFGEGSLAMSVDEH